MKEIIKTVLETNPGLFSAVVLPVAILLITFWQNRRIKKLENKYLLDKEEKTRQMDQKFDSKKEIREQERIVHSSLVRILFDIQKLHIDLSTDCVDYKCISDGLSKFNESFDKNQKLISDNLLCLPSEIINNIYAFYKRLSELIIELKDYKDQGNQDLAMVSVYFYARLLADDIIDIQHYIIKERQKEEEAEIEFDKLKVEMMRYCCGRTPPKELRDRYEELKKVRLEKFVKEEEEYYRQFQFLDFDEELELEETDTSNDNEK